MARSRATIIRGEWACRHAVLVWACASDSSRPFVAVAQPADHRDADNTTLTGRFDGPREWCIACQRQVTPGLMVVVEVYRQNAMQMLLVEHDDMVETFTADGPAEPFHERILPRTPMRGRRKSLCHKADGVFGKDKREFSDYLAVTSPADTPAPASPAHSSLAPPWFEYPPTPSPARHAWPSAQSGPHSSSTAPPPG